jgi:hypothetical protein
MDLFLESDYDAMVNYEALLIETNNELQSRVKNSCILSILWTEWSWLIVLWALSIRGEARKRIFSPCRNICFLLRHPNKI